MTYVITQNCCKDASCVPVCPVDCIRPVDGAGDTEMLYIDPEACIDCGACAEECPVEAIYYEDDLPESQVRYRDIAADYFRAHPLTADDTPEPRPHAPVQPGALRIAVVGAGPAACYAAAELLEVDGVEVDLFERLPTPFGLIRAGVAPDHQRTKSIADMFSLAFTNRRFGCHLNVEIGERFGHADLLAHHHAVIYAVGAPSSRDLGIPGEGLPGSHPAADFVGWYNGHPDHSDRGFDLSGQRAVIIGNGNVTLDAARALLMSRDELTATDIADHALEALSDSAIEEVVVLGRRGPRDAAFSVGEFLALGDLPGIDVIIDADCDLSPGPDDDVETAMKLTVAREYRDRAPVPGNKRVVFRFHCAPVAIEGDDAVTGIRLRDTRTDADAGVLPASLVLRSIGYRGTPMPDLPFDEATGTIPNDGGRVVADAAALPGVYVTGWIKRGPRGVIGTNRTCAAQTVAALWADFDAGVLTRDVADRAALTATLADRGLAEVDWSGWRAIDKAERGRGADGRRPRVKFVTVEELLAASRP